MGAGRRCPLRDPALTASSPAAAGCTGAAGRDILEIGYWVHRDFLRRGVATEASRLLRDAALEAEGIEHVQIHCDRANAASNAVPERLGFTLIAENRIEPEAPAEEGVDCVWRFSRR